MLLSLWLFMMVAGMPAKMFANNSVAEEDKEDEEDQATQKDAVSARSPRALW